MLKFISRIAKQIATLARKRQFYLTYAYAFFLVFIIPLSVPLAIWTAYQGLVTSEIIWMTIIMYCLSGLGISVGYHRLVTHRSFQTPSWMKRFILICGSFAM